MEQKLRVLTAVAVGTATKEAWSQVVVNNSTIEKTQVIISLEYRGDSELIDLSEIGTSLLESLAEKNFLNDRDLTDISEGIDKGIAIVSIQEKKFSVSGVGDVEVFLMRKGMLGRVFVGKAELSKAEGVIEKGDKWLVCTNSTEKRLGLGKIKEEMEKGVSDGEGLAVAVRGMRDSSGTAAVMGEADWEEPEQERAPSYQRLQSFTGFKDKTQELLSKIKIRRPLYISEEKRSRNMWIGITLLVLLILGVAIGLVRRSKLASERTYTQLESGVTQKITEAKSIGDLNPERAKLLLTQGKGEIEIYLESTEDKEYLTKARELLNQLSIAETEVFKKQEVELSTLSELSVIREGLKAEKMYMDADGNILIPSLNEARVAGINAEDKSSFVISTDGVGKIRELAQYKNTIYGVAQGGIASITDKEQKIAIEPDELWKEITLIDTFAGNVYLLDKGQSDIWKYPALTDGFGARRRWLGAGIILDLTRVVDMKVDGDIWLLTETGKLERYSQGVPVEFSMEGLPAMESGKLADPAAVFVTETEVLVLERMAKRVVVFNKETGIYERQYGADAFSEGKDLVVYENRAYVLTGDRIVWFEL